MHPSQELATWFDRLATAVSAIAGGTADQSAADRPSGGLHQVSGRTGFRGVFRGRLVAGTDVNHARRSAGPLYFCRP